MPVAGCCQCQCPFTGKLYWLYIDVDVDAVALVIDSDPRRASLTGIAMMIDSDLDLIDRKRA